MSRSSLIEDIGEYNRVHEMFQNLKPDNETKCEFIEGFKNSMSLNTPIATDTTDPLDFLHELKRVKAWL